MDKEWNRLFHALLETGLSREYIKQIQDFYRTNALSAEQISELWLSKEPESAAKIVASSETESPVVQADLETEGMKSLISEHGNSNELQSIIIAMLRNMPGMEIIIGVDDLHIFGNEILEVNESKVPGTMTIRLVLG